jgi:hypothetical protein
MLPLIVCLIMGVVCAIIAHSKGRSAIGWFFVGLLLGLIGLIIVLVISNVREEEARQQSIEQENRRLREQIRHDQKLGIDTRADGRVLEGEAPVSGLLQSNETIAPPASPVASPVTAPEGGPPDWYYAIGAQTFGPVAAGKITQLLRDKTIPETVMVWTEGMANWSPIEQVPQLNIPVNP